MVKVRGKKIVRVVPDMSRVRIAALGHSPKQFESIPYRNWLSPTYLDQLDLKFYNDYQENNWSEARAFLCDSLFNYSKCDYVGVVSASWNKKFYRPNLEKIDRHEHIHSLFHPHNKSVLTAMVEPFSIWEKAFTRIGFVNGDKFYDFVKSYSTGKDTNKPVPLFNQVICHKSIYINLCEFHKSVAHEVKDFVDKYGDVLDSSLVKTRRYAYVAEAMTMAYFQSKDYNYVPVAKLHPQWRDPKAARKRLRYDSRQTK